MTAPEKTRRSHGGTILAAAVVLLLVALFAVPGYIAALYCKVTHDRYSEAAIESYDYLPSGWRNPRPCIGLQIYLAPAYLLSEIAPPLRIFYLRQFIARRGRIPHCLYKRQPFHVSFERSRHPAHT